MKVGRLLLRIAVGSFFVGHGTQKLFGWFGGQGLGPTAEQFDAMGVKPGKLQATAAGFAETAGGAALVAGYQTPLASAGIISVMLTAIQRVHLKNGPWAQKGGYEYNVVLLTAAAALAESGPGALSLDALRGKQREGAKWSIFALTLGAVGAAGAHLLTEKQAAKQVEPVVPGNSAVAAEAAPEPEAVPEPVSAPAKANGRKSAKAAAVEDASSAEPVVEVVEVETEPEVEAAIDADADADAETES
jgi:putative oxidoreductase